MLNASLRVISVLRLEDRVIIYLLSGTKLQKTIVLMVKNIL